MNRIFRRALPLLLALILLAGVFPAVIYAVDTSGFISAADTNSTQSNVLEFDSTAITLRSAASNPVRNLTEAAKLTTLVLSAPRWDNGNYSVIPGVTYTLEMTFTESDPLTFPEEEAILLYPFPEGFLAAEKAYQDVTIYDGTIWDVKTAGEAEKENGIYRVSENVMMYYFSPEDVAGDAPASVTFIVEGTFAADTGTLLFPDGEDGISVTLETAPEEEEVVTLSQSVGSAELSRKEIVWNVNFNVPKSGLSRAVLTDYVPKYREWVEMIREDRIVITGLFDGETCDYVFHEDSVDLVFYQDAAKTVPGLQHGPARNITVQLVSAMSEGWLAASLKDPDARMHKNTVTLDDGSGTLKSAEAEAAVKGSIRITKGVVVNGSTETGTLADGTYVFTILKDGQPVAEAWAKGKKLVNGQVELAILNGKLETVEVTGLEEGTYVVREEKPENGADLVGQNDRETPVRYNEITDQYFLNNMKVNTGTLRVNKRISSVVLEKMTDEQKQRILFTVKGANGLTRTFTLADMGESLSYYMRDLPTGTYTVKETGADDKENVPSGYAFRRLSYSVADGKIAVAKNRTSSVTVTNIYAVSKPSGGGGGGGTSTVNVGGGGGGGGTPTTVEISGKVTWEDDENAAGRRPESITIELYADERLIETRTVTGEDNWEWTFKNLERKNKDTDANIRYTLREYPVSKYDAIVNGYNITNRYNPFKQETVFARIRKVWDDNNDASGMRPESVTATLSNGATVILRESNDWMGTVTDLPRYDKGQPILYTWEEDPIPGFRQSNVTTAENLTVITSTCIITPRKDLSEVSAQGGITYPDDYIPELPGDPVADIDSYNSTFPLVIDVNHVGDTFD